MQPRALISLLRPGECVRGRCTLQTVQQSAARLSAKVRDVGWNWRCCLPVNHQLKAESGRSGYRHGGWPRARHIREAESCDYRVLSLLSVVELIVEDVGIDPWYPTSRVVELAGSPLECELVIRIRATV